MHLNAQQQFLYEHEEQTREWADLLRQADTATVTWLREEMPPRLDALGIELGASVRSMEIDSGRWPRVMLHRPEWPTAADTAEPLVAVAWEINVGAFNPAVHGPYVGVRAIARATGPALVARIRSEAPAGYTRTSGWWPAYTYCNADEGWWEDGEAWLASQVTAAGQAWADLAGLIDAALSDTPLEVPDQEPL